MQLPVVDARVGAVAAVREEGVLQANAAAVTGHDPFPQVGRDHLQRVTVGPRCPQVVDVLGEVVDGVAARTGARHRQREHAGGDGREVHRHVQFVLLHVRQVQRVGNGSRVVGDPGERRLRGKRQGTNKQEQEGSNTHGGGLSGRVERNPKSSQRPPFFKPAPRRPAAAPSAARRYSPGSSAAGIYEYRPAPASRSSRPAASAPRGSP